MRKLMLFGIGFAGACALGAYFLDGIWPMLLAVCILFTAIILFLPQERISKITAWLLLGCSIGFFWFWGYDSIYLSNARNLSGETVFLSITAADNNFDPGYGCAFDGRTEIDGKAYQVRCYLDDVQQIRPGDVVEGKFRLRYTPGENQKDATYHQGKGIFLLASQKSEVTVTAGRLRIWDYPSAFRNKLLSIMEAVFPDDTAGFAKALLLGDSTDLSYQNDRSFQVTGLRHVIAVSGLHVSILFAIVYLLFGHQRVLNLVIGTPVLIFFAAVAGFTPSIVRACVMQLLMLLAMVVDKEYDPATALAFAVLVILGVNPRTVTAVGFQLSVGCMIGIFAFSASVSEYLMSFGKLKMKSKGKSFRAKLIRWIVGSVSVTLSAMVVTTPLCAVYFGMVSLVSIPANLLTLWIISFVFYGIMLTCAMGALWLPLGKLLGWILSWPIRYVLAVSGLLAKFPLSAVYTDSIYIVFWLVFSYLLLVVFFCLKKKHPLTTAACIAVLLCVCIAMSWLEPKTDDTRVSVIDVGQGQSVLLQHEGAYYLVDCGGEHDGITADTVANFLLSMGVFRLDGVILTHYDTDHAGAVLNLLTSVGADKIYMPDRGDSNGIREELLRTHEDKISLISGISELPISGGKITLYPGNDGLDDNESSVCVLFQTGNCDILITGDRSAVGERALLKQAELPKLDVLVAGHHGSHEATSLELLMATQPAAVVISVGADNPYGHPREEILNRLSNFNCEIYRTDLQGTITFRR